MQITEYIDALESEGNRLVETASRFDLDALVPTCPEWTLRDVIRHLGGVHRWAGAHVRDRRDSILAVSDLEILFGTWPTDAELLDWYRSELHLLVGSLRAAPLDLDCAVFLRSESPLAHWTRRQAHETTIHRADVELIGGELTAVGHEFGADGIDELLSGFSVRKWVKVRSDSPLALSIRPNDSDRSWRVEITNEPIVTVEPSTGPFDCEVHGRASDIYFSLWNRLPEEAVLVNGDSSILSLFKERVKVTWA